MTTRAIYDSKYQQSPKGRIAHARKQHRYAQTPRGKLVLAEAQLRYRETLNGRLHHLRTQEKRQRNHTDLDNYIRRVRLLHENKLSCKICGRLYELTHQIDHIIPLFLGGSDADINLREACLSCHRKKTANDLKRKVDTC